METLCIPCPLRGTSARLGTQFSKANGFRATDVQTKGCSLLRLIPEPLAFFKLQFAFGCFIDGGVDAGWSSPVARQAHNLKVVSSNLAPATKKP